MSGLQSRCVGRHVGFITSRGGVQSRCGGLQSRSVGFVTRRVGPTQKSAAECSSRLPYECVVAEGVFPTSQKVSDFGNYSRTRDSIPMSGNSSELLPDIGKRFPMSRNSFRYRKTVSDVGKQFPVSGNGFRCRGTVPIPELLLDVGKPFPMSENDFRYWETVYAVGEHLDRFEQIRTEQESRLHYRSSQERIKKVFYALLI